MRKTCRKRLEQERQRSIAEEHINAVLMARDWLRFNERARGRGASSRNSAERQVFFVGSDKWFWLGHTHEDVLVCEWFSGVVRYANGIASV